VRSISLKSYTFNFYSNIVATLTPSVSKQMVLLRRVEKTGKVLRGGACLICAANIPYITQIILITGLKQL
jgi:hypothetical protein